MTHEPNEHTSHRVAQIAGRVLEYLQPFDDDEALWYRGENVPITMGDIKALAASCLTQTEGVVMCTCGCTEPSHDASGKCRGCDCCDFTAQGE